MDSDEDITVREYVDQRYVDVARRVDEVQREVAQRFDQQARFDAMLKTTLDESVAAAIEEARQARIMIERQMAVHATAHEREHEMTETAISKAEGMMADRLQALAEATQLRAEQAGEVIGRGEHEQLRAQVTEESRQQQEAVASLTTRKEHDALREQVTELAKSGTPRAAFDETRRLVYMGLGMAVASPVLLTLLYFVAEG